MRSVRWRYLLRNGEIASVTLIQRVRTLAVGQPSDSNSGIEAAIGARSSSASTTGAEGTLIQAERERRAITRTASM